MDPNVALKHVRELVTDALIEHDERTGGELAEVIDGLDDWLTKGGFSPEPWFHPSPADDALSELHRLLYPESYGVTEHGEPAPAGYVYEWSADTIEAVAAIVRHAVANHVREAASDGREDRAR